MIYFIILIAVILGWFYLYQSYYVDLLVYCLGNIAIITLAFIWYMWPMIQEDQKKAEAARRASQIPHIINRVDGCDIYAFVRNGREHYFTRCPKTTETETTLREHRQPKSSTISTENY